MLTRVKWAVYEAQQFGKVEHQNDNEDPFINLSPISLERFTAHSEDYEDGPITGMLLLSVKKLKV